MAIEPLSSKRPSAAPERLLGAAVARPSGRRASPTVPYTPRAMDAAEKRVEQELVRHHPSADVTLIDAAYRFAREAHESQKRVSGE
nr:bifunctional (p)ppGpp synthetase/guanosine-3',5'-bis(diphosphate) 3'-pyrophosphohydrolase [Chloroflexota bacterium]